MATPQEDKNETVSTPLTNSEMDPTVKAMFDALLRQIEMLSQQIKILTLRMDESLTRTPMEKIPEASSLITHTAKDQSVLREHIPIPQIPPQSEDRIFPERLTQPKVKAKDALKCIPQLNGEDDIGVEQFIKEVKEVKTMCSEQYLLLKMIKIEKISGKAAMAIRNVHISEYAHLYEALRQNVGTQASVRENQDQLRNIKQGFNESVQSYVIRFRKLYNELQYSIIKECPDEITRRAMNDIIMKDSITDFIRGLKTKIGQLLLDNPPHNVIEAEKRAAKIEKYFRENRTRKQQTLRFDDRLQYKPQPVTYSTSTPLKPIQHTSAQQPKTTADFMSILCRDANTQEKYLKNKDDKSLCPSMLDSSKRRNAVKPATSPKFEKIVYNQARQSNTNKILPSALKTKLAQEKSEIINKQKPSENVENKLTKEEKRGIKQKSLSDSKSGTTDARQRKNKKNSLEAEKEVGEKKKNPDGNFMMKKNINGNSN